MAVENRGRVMGERGSAGCQKRRQVARQSHSRFGGEEFAMILANADLDTAMMIAERVRTTIMGGEMKRRSTGENLGKLTVSIGVAAFQDTEGARSLIKRADGCLYEAKRTGRNRVVTAGPNLRPEETQPARAATG